MTLVSTFSRELDTLLIHFRTTLGMVGDCGNYAQRAYDEDMLDAKNMHLDLFRHWDRWNGGLWFGEL